MVYLDNAATSYPKPRCVYEALIKSLYDAPGNPGRSSHKLSVAAAEAVYSCRENLASLINAPSPEGVVFTYNATHALNLAIKSYLKTGTHILTSDIEHNSVIRPLEALKAERLIDYSVFSSGENIEKSIESKLRGNTSCIVSTNASNVTGKIIPLDCLSRLAKKHGLALIIDASQSIGHFNIDLSKTSCDVICGPGHKALFGIQGVGFAVFSDLTRKKSWVEGGSGTESINIEMPMHLPEGYEAGTPATPAICSLNRGIEFIREIGIDSVEEKIKKLTELMYERFASVKGIKIYSAGNGLISFNYKDYPSSYTASLLDKENIYVRSGLHCAPSAHRLMGTINGGTLRASVSVLNTVENIDEAYKAMKSIASTN